MNKKILFLLVSFITFICLMTLGHYLLKPEGLSKVNVLDEGWNARYNGREFTDIKLSDLRELIGDGTQKATLLCYPDMSAV